MLHCHKCFIFHTPLKNTNVFVNTLLQKHHLDKLFIYLFILFLLSLIFLLELPTFSDWVSVKMP